MVLSSGRAEKGTFSLVTRPNCFRECIQNQRMARIVLFSEKVTLYSRPILIVSVFQPLCLCGQSKVRFGLGGLCNLQRTPSQVFSFLCFQGENKYFFLAGTRFSRMSSCRRTLTTSSICSTRSWLARTLSPKSNSSKLF